MLSCLGSVQQPLSTFGFQLFVGSTQMFEQIKSTIVYFWGEQTLLIVCIALYLIW